MAEVTLDPASIQAVAFDAYGTLFYWDFAESAREVIEMQGLEVDHEAFARTFVMAWLKVSPWSDQQYLGEDGRPDRGHMLAGPVPEWISTYEMWRRQFEIAFAEFNLPGDATSAAHYLREVLSVAPAYPDAYQTIERLAAHGFRIGLLSNADEDFVQSAVSHNRLRFSVIQSSESLHTYKPNRAAFTALCARLGVPPASVLYVGDSGPTDIGGASHAGLRTAWIRRDETPYAPTEEPPDLEILSLREVADLLCAGPPRWTPGTPAAAVAGWEG